VLITGNHLDEKRRDIASNCTPVCRRFCNECLGVVAVTLLRVQEVSGLSFAQESVCLTDFLWFYWAPADKVLDIT
jgi:hypothetical protein